MPGFLSGHYTLDFVTCHVRKYEDNTQETLTIIK